MREARDIIELGRSHRLLASAYCGRDVNAAFLFAHRVLLRTVLGDRSGGAPSCERGLCSLKETTMRGRAPDAAPS